MRTYLTFLVVINFFNPLIAGTGKISGIIVDKHSGNGIAGVNIYLEGTGIGNFTDGNGSFSIEGINEGNYTLKASAIGYQSISRNIEVSENLTSELKLSLAESIEVLNGIVVKRVSLIGGSNNISDIPGSSHFISQKELSKFNYSDVNQVLRNVPGIIIQEEEGFGLRPNIGMRGTGVERSSKITIMEDGILMAPAPYAAPAAYYFPSVARMAGVEVRKGSSQIKYGPNTTGGAINFFSTYLPEDFVAQANLIAGSFGYHQAHAYAGKSFKNGGILAESLLLNSNGFKNLDNGGNTGFIKQDYLVKGRINTNPDANVYQALNFKIGLTEENSNETYLGLTEEDFAESPYRRYAGSQEDIMKNTHRQWHLRHLIQPAEFIDITTTVYRNDFSRNWYKLDKVKSPASGSAVGISSILEDPETYADELSIIKGETSQNDDALFVKANNRSYYSQGVESIFGFNFSTSGLDHEIESGLRIHQDQMDRFQWVDAYRMEDGTMLMTEKGTPGTDSNYLLNADAIASFIRYNADFNHWSISGGLRYENINYNKTNYGTNDLDRTGSDLIINENSTDILIPGIGVDYSFNSFLSSFVGIHKGFTPPGSDEGTKPEISWNYEAGLRYSNRSWNIISTIYYNDYDNLLGSDLAATGGSGTTTQFNGGESLIYGLEQEINYELAHLVNTNFSLPLSFRYTFTKAQFGNSFESEYEPWGVVEKGDEIPYLPQHQLVVNLGIYFKRISFDISTKYAGEMRTVAGQGEISSEYLISGYFIGDISANYRLAKYIDVFGGVFNVLDEVYEVSRRPAGLRPGMPRNFRLGIKANIN